jgi:molybdate transport system regulatory protein
MKLKSKIWLEHEGKLIFGLGKCGILKAVAKYGSLNTAAKKLGMSYRSVWSHINAVEKRFGRALLIKTKGGKNGGGARLTPFADKLVERFVKIETDIKKYADKKWGQFIFPKKEGDK